MTDWSRWFVESFEGRTEDETAEILAKVLGMDVNAAREKMRRALRTDAEEKSHE